MSAWLRSSWTARRSPEDSRRWFAEGMPEDMGMDALVESLTDPPFVQALLHRANREPLATPADEDRAFLGAVYCARTGSQDRIDSTA